MEGKITDESGVSEKPGTGGRRQEGGGPGAREVQRGRPSKMLGGVTGRVQAENGAIHLSDWIWIYNILV